MSASQPTATLGQGAIAPDISTVTWLLILAFVSLMVVRRTKLPYTIALVIVGFIVGLTHLLTGFALSRELVFTLFLPPLLFDAAIRLPTQLLARRWRPVALLAGPGVVVGTFLVGYAVHWGLGLDLTASLLFGALISAIDPVAVLARFRNLNVDRRMAIIVEGEGLFNDGTATVMYAALLRALVSGKPVTFGGVSIDIVQSIAGGVLLGAGVGYAIAFIMGRINDNLGEITLTTIAAYGSSLLGQTIGVSGVISVITCGMVIGYFRGEAVMSATSRAAIYSFWEYIAFVVNSFLFLLIGIDVTVGKLAANIGPIALAIGIVSVARSVVVYSTGLLERSTVRPISWKWLHVFNLGGLRGALAIALAVSLPSDSPGRSVIGAMTYGIVLWTLLVQGLSLGWVLRKLGFVGAEEARDEYQRLMALRQARRASQDELDRMRREGLVSGSLYRQLSDEIKQDLEQTETKLDEFQEKHGEMRREQLDEVRRRLMIAQQIAIREQVESGLIASDMARDLVSTIAEDYEPKGDDTSAGEAPEDGGKGKGAGEKRDEGKHKEGE